MIKQPVNIFWFRRDLRLDDNVGLFKALESEQKVHPIFIFDSEILENLPEDDARLTFIYDTLQYIRKSLQNNYGSSLALYYGKPLDIFQKLVANYAINTVFCNSDYEPYAKERDLGIRDFLKSKDIAFKSYKDQVIFEKDEIVKSDGKPYVVYTPYMKLWKATFKNHELKNYPSETLLDNLIQNERLPNLSLKDIKFVRSNQKIKPFELTSKVLADYETLRNFPAKDATSHIGPYLRFGTVSIRNVVKKAISSKDEIFLQELIWREFFMQILWHFPQTLTDSFKPQYDRIEWRNNKKEFEKWCSGQTGYPLVDAGMRQLNETGFMHNRVRMVVASFLCKHLLIDWRWGEAYFAEKLHDYEMSSNVGNWQWAAGSGVDAAPYFRIFNPTTQIEKFDKDLKYINKWVPEFQELNYASPIVDHKEARERCLMTYKKALN